MLLLCQLEPLMVLCFGVWSESLRRRASHCDSESVTRGCDCHVVSTSPPSGPAATMPTDVSWLE